MNNKEMADQDKETYAQYEAATRQLLIRHKAEDLLPMLGLEEEPSVPDNN